MYTYYPRYHLVTLNLSDCSPCQVTTPHYSKHAPCQVQPLNPSFLKTCPIAPCQSQPLITGTCTTHTPFKLVNNKGWTTINLKWINVCFCTAHQSTIGKVKMFKFKKVWDGSSLHILTHGKLNFSFYLKYCEIHFKIYIFLI